MHLIHNRTRCKSTPWYHPLFGNKPTLSRLYNGVTRIRLHNRVFSDRQSNRKETQNVLTESAPKRKAIWPRTTAFSRDGLSVVRKSQGQTSSLHLRSSVILSSDLPKIRLYPNIISQKNLKFNRIDEFFEILFHNIQCDVYLRVEI